MNAGDIFAKIFSIGYVIYDSERTRHQARQRSSELKEAAEKLPSSPEITTGIPTTSIETGTKPPEIALEAHSLDYQLDTLLDDLQHLETEHLPAQGRLQGLPCDCIAKVARDLRRHARETIPIAAREGIDATIFSEMAAEGEHLIEIGTVETVRTGVYDAEYLKHAGTISNYRKAVESMRAELRQKGDRSCPECATLKELSRYMEYQRKQKERPESSKQSS